MRRPRSSRLRQDPQPHARAMLVVLEATRRLRARGGRRARGRPALPVVVANPRQVRDFARATGSWRRPMPSMPRRWRSSPSGCAPRPAPLPDEAAQALDAAAHPPPAAPRDADGRAQSPQPRPARWSAAASHRTFAGCSASSTRRIASSGSSSSTARVWRAQDDLLQSVPGVGPIAQPHPAGRAPGTRPAHPQTDRGAGRGGPARPRQWHATRQAVDLGRPRPVRAVLYMGALAAVRWNPVSAPSIGACARRANRPRSRWSPACGSC